MNAQAIPSEVIHAAEFVGRYFEKHHIKNWEVGPCKARDMLPDAIASVITSIADRSTMELLGMSESLVKELWYFTWDSRCTIAWNIYKFSDALEQYKRLCRQWEEHHNGPGCLVERVRDKYLTPRVVEFIATLTEKMMAEGQMARIKLTAQMAVDAYRSRSPLDEEAAMRCLVAALKPEKEPA